MARAWHDIVRHHFIRAPRVLQLTLIDLCSESQKVIEDIKMRILLYTGKLGRKNNTNEVEHEKLTMYPPTCE